MTTPTQHAECVVCAESFTKRACCPFCFYTTCRLCAQTYILGELTPKCMKCRKDWSREIQLHELTATFVNGPLKKHTETVLFEGQRALLSATLEIYEREHNIKMARKASSEAATKFRLHREAVEHPKYKLQYNALVKDVFGDLICDTIEEQNALLESSGYNKLYKIIRNIETDPVYKALQTDYIHKRTTYKDLQYMEWARQRDEREAQTQNYNASVKNEPRFIRACPAENCRGFLNTQWECRLCNLSTCSECFVVKGPEQTCDLHVCNPDDVASAQLLIKDSKPCPKCAACIFKIDGCDQMWCTMCHTAFSWNTGYIETNRIHNPHFLEHQRRENAIIPRAIGDIPCGRDLDQQTMNYMQHIMTSKNLCESLIIRIHDIIRAAFHLKIVVRTRYRHDRVVDFQELRKKYISSQIDEHKFRTRLARDMKTHNKKCEIGVVIQTLLITLIELLFRFFHEIEEMPTDEIYQNLHTLDEINRLYEYTNECLSNICHVYGSTRIGVRIMDPETLHEPIHHGTGVYTIKNKK